MQRVLRQQPWQGGSGHTDRSVGAVFQALNCLLRTLETAAKLKSEAAKSEKTLKAQKHCPSKTTQ